MTAYKAPDFNERAALSRQAKQKALDKLRAKPAASEEEIAAKKAARLEREEAEAEKRRAKRAAEQEAKAEEARKAAEAKAKLAEAQKSSVMSEADKKSERDARYAARKARK